jgi:signal peptidase I
MKKYFGLTIWLIVGSVISHSFFRHYGVSASIVQGSSMEPTYHNNQKVFVNAWTLLWRNPYKGEVILVRDSQDGKIDMKRIAAVPGDLVNKSGINSYKLRKDEYFVLGDNSKNSYDSRYYGPVTRNQILAVVE